MTDFERPLTTRRAPSTGIRLALLAAVLFGASAPLAKALLGGVIAPVLLMLGLGRTPAS